MAERIIMRFFKILKELWKEDRGFRFSVVLSHVSLIVSIIAIILSAKA